MNKVRVFADFHNADVKGRVRLNCVGTIADLERQGIVLRDGLSLIIYSEELEVEGVVHYSEEEKLWTAVIDWNAIQEVEPVVSQLTIQDVIQEIEQKSKGGGYIYRGEQKCYCKVSSSLYRQYGIQTERFDIEVVQKETLAAAKKHTKYLRQDFAAFLNLSGRNTDEAIDFEILVELQHCGSNTNLIAFTTDYRIALFWACDGAPSEDGRLILQRTKTIKDWIHYSRNPRHRVVTQKNRFVRPPKGFIEPDEDGIVTISADLKKPMLEYLQNYHDISTETIYSDLHGFIRSQGTHESAYAEFYRGLACGDKVIKATTDEEEQREYEKSIVHYTKAIELKSGFSEAYYNRGNAYRERGDFENAIEDYNTAIKLKSDYAEAHYKRGNVYTRKEDYDNAIEDYNTAIKLKPDYAEAYNNRGFAYDKKDKPDHAIEDCNIAIKLKPDYAEAYNNRGTTYGKRGYLDHAIEDLNTAVELNPNYAEAYCNRGIAYQNMDELDKAIIDCDKAIQLKSNFAEFYYNRGIIYIKKGEFDRAIGDFSKSIQLKPDYAEAYYNRSGVYLKKGEFDKAIEDYTKVIELQPDSASAYHNRGNIYREKGEFENAINDYTQAIQLKSDYASAYYCRAVAQLHLQTWEEAKSDLITVENLGEDIAAVFRNAFGSVENFEQRTGIQLPEDIATLLTRPQA